MAKKKLAKKAAKQTLILEGYTLVFARKLKFMPGLQGYLMQYVMGMLGLDSGSEDDKAFARKTIEGIVKA